MADRWEVVDRRTGKPVTYATFLSEESAISHIAEWRDRGERGGRPDISRDLLSNMEPRRLSASSTPEETDA